MKANALKSCALRSWAAHAVTVITVAVVPVVLTTTPTHAGPPLGINTSFITDYNGDVLFADAMKTSRQWSTTNLDANGWPNQDANIYVWADAVANRGGTYAVSFNGQATISGATVVGQSYISSTNTTTATITLSGTSPTLLLTFSNTRKTSSSALNTGVANVRLMRPTTPGGSTPYAAGTLFTTHGKALYAKFAVIRFMDWTATNENPQANWSDRTRPGWATQFRWQGTIWSSPDMGASWEHAIQLCNEIDRDMWINVPINATNDYINKLAQLIRYGSDGTLPYTSAQSNPVYPPLEANLNVYVEYGNEVWNWGAGFNQSYNDNRNAAVAEVNAGGSPLNFDGDTNQDNWAARRTAKRTIEIGNIFRTVFGESAMMTRIRPVLESQSCCTGFWFLQQSRLLEDYYNNATRVATPRPPSYYVYGGGGAAYYNPNNSDPNLNLNNIWTSETFNIANWIPICVDNTAYAKALFGRRIAYEGGPSMDKFDTNSQGVPGPVDSAKQQAWSDARMTPLVVDHHSTWQQTGGDLLVYFDATGDFSWGFAQHVYDLNTRKLIAIDQINASTPLAGTFGMPIPGTITGSAFDAPETFAVNANALSASGGSSATWLGYLVASNSAGAFNIALSAGSAGSGNQADIYVDGVFVGTLAVANTGSNTSYATTSAVTTASLPVGTHGLKIKARAGTFGVGSIIVTSAGGGTLPGAPGTLSATAGNAQVSLSWGAASGATSYNIYRGTSPGGESPTPIATGITTTTFTNTGLTNGTTYYYKVAGVNGSGTGPQSNEALATPSASGGGGPGPKVITSIRFYPRPGEFGWRMQGGVFQGSSDNANWTTLDSLANVWPPNDTWTTRTVSNSTAWRYVRFVSNTSSGYALNVAELEFYNGTTKLVGTGIGTSGSYQNDPNRTFDKALDGNISTFVDNVAGAFVGYDFGAGGGGGGGAASQVTSVRLYPRSGVPERMTSGQFQGSNNNSTWTTLATVATQPANNAWTTLTVSNTTAWRYLRYLSPNNSWGNVAEIEFYNGATKLTGTGIGTPGSWQNQGNTFDKAIDGNTATFFDSPDANGSFVGIDRGP